MKTALLLPLVLLAFFLLWKETKRAARQHLGWRIVASLLALASLALLVFPPTYTVEVTGKEQHEIVVLTPGYDKEDPAALPALPLYTTDPALATHQVAYIPNLPLFLGRHPAIGSIQVRGYGLDRPTLDQLRALGIALHYHTPALPAGFTAAGWPRQLHKGEWLEVQGQYNNSTGDSVRIVLTGLGTRFDSATIAPHSAQPFALRCKPQHTGNTLYGLAATVGSRELITEKLPVHVRATRPLRLLVLNSSPDFDNKFLAGWLYDNQYQVAVRSTVSQNKYSRRFLNQPATALQSITPAILEPLDVLIADEGALATLSPGEKAHIRAQVQKGMGLLLQVDSTGWKDPLTAGLQLRPQRGIPVGARPLLLPASWLPTAPVQPAQWLSIDRAPQVQPIVTDEQGAVVAAASLYGAGKLVVNTINQTYSWVLKGQQADYARFWTTLLQKAARRPSQAVWQQVTALPAVSDPVQIDIETTAPGLPQVETPDGNIAMAQQAWLPGSYTGTWWPTTRGWQTIRQANDSLDLFIFEATDWRSVRATASISANRSYSAVNGREAASKIGPDRREQRQVPPVIFLLVFLGCCSYLWWEEKRARSMS